MANVRIVPATKTANTLVEGCSYTLVGDQIRATRFDEAKGAWVDVTRSTLSTAEQIALRDRLIAKHPLPAPKPDPVPPVTSPPPTPPAPPTPDPVPPVTQPTTPTPPPTPTLRPVPSIGINGSGAWSERTTQALTALPGLQWVRLDMAGSAAWKSTWAQEAFPVARRADARVILLVPDNQTASPSFVAFVKQWLKPDDEIEYGNETNYADASTLFASGNAYGLRLKAFVAGLRAAGLNHGVLAQGDPAMRGSGWNDGMYTAVPNVHDLVDGFTVHPYGPMEATFQADGKTLSRDGARARIATMVAQLQKHGAPADVAVWVTEDGCSSDNGVMLDGNYDWPRDQTHREAGLALAGKVRALASLPQNIVAWVCFQDVDQGYAAPDPRATRGREDHFGAVERTGKVKVDFVAPLVSLIREWASFPKATG